MVVSGVVVPISICIGRPLFFRQVRVLTILIEMLPQVRHQVET
jgi:hypothetical protein